MNRYISLGCICVVSVVLASCDKQTPKHSVAYYKQNASERSAILARCKAEPDLFASDTNCRAAADAEALSGVFTPSKPKAW